MIIDISVMAWILFFVLLDRQDGIDVCCQREERFCHVFALRKRCGFQHRIRSESLCVISCDLDLAWVNLYRLILFLFVLGRYEVVIGEKPRSNNRTRSERF